MYCTVKHAHPRAGQIFVAFGKTRHKSTGNVPWCGSLRQKMTNIGLQDVTRGPSEGCAGFVSESRSAM
jgi:hypothetical protein